MLFADQPVRTPQLVGIARLAAQATTLAEKARVEYFELPSKSVLNRCSNPHMPFRWTINPYRGCEFGCKYCYARYTHEFMGMDDDGTAFESKIYAKREAAALLRRDLARRPRGGIAIGTSTDPYQPAERRFEVTRSLLEVFAAGGGHDLSITTKGDLILRDTDVLIQVANNNRLSVNITVTTLDAELARRLEPRAPRPDLRLAAVARLARAGLTVGVFANPVMPGLTDAPDNLEALAAAARRAGASYFGGGSLFLMPSAKQQFLPFLERERPDLADDYRRSYSRNAYLRGEQVERLAARVDEARKRHGLPSKPPEREAAPVPSAQLELFR